MNFMGQLIPLLKILADNKTYVEAFQKFAGALTNDSSTILHDALAVYSFEIELIKVKPFS